MESDEMNELGFSGKTVLVVGGSSGLGNGIAQKFREKGAQVEVWGTRPSLQDYDDERCDYNGLTYRQVDVSSSENVAAAAQGFTSLDVLVLSQGIMMPLEEFGIEAFNRVLTVNLVSFMDCSTQFKDLLVASKGSVIMMNSIASQQAITLTPAYGTAKYGMTGLTKILAKAWGPDGVRVNGVAPGVIETRMIDPITSNPEYRSAIVARQPFGRLGTVEEVANVALFLASPLASFITGQTLVVDGGYTLWDIL